MTCFSFHSCSVFLIHLTNLLICLEFNTASICFLQFSPKHCYYSITLDNVYVTIFSFFSTVYHVKLLGSEWNSSFPHTNCVSRYINGVSHNWGLKKKIFMTNKIVFFIQIFSSELPVVYTETSSFISRICENSLF